MYTIILKIKSNKLFFVSKCVSDIYFQRSRMRTFKNENFWEKQNKTKNQNENPQRVNTMPTTCWFFFSRRKLCMHIDSVTDRRTLTFSNTLLFVSLSHTIKKALYWAVICLTNCYNKNLLQILTALKWHHFTIMNAVIFPSGILNVVHTEASRQNRNCSWCCTSGEMLTPCMCISGKASDTQKERHLTHGSAVSSSFTKAAALNMLFLRTVHKVKCIYQ